MAARGRRIALLGLLLSLSLLQACATLDPQWSAYKARFLDGGRIVDTGNRGVSHSEGQGWGMLFAEAHGDRQAFDRLWDWTRSHLQRDDLALFAWRFDPAATDPVADRNNASDGDVLIAWALLRAAQRWQEPSYADASAAIRQAIAEQLLRTHAGYRVLLPGLVGFERDEQLVVNLSYLVVPAFQAFALQEPDGDWQRLVEDGERLLAGARFGAHALPPDWLAVDRDGTLAPAEGWPPRFGFDAVRVPLYHYWGGMPASDSKLAPFTAFWRCCETPHAWVDLRSGELSPYPASTGVRAIGALLEGAAAPVENGNEDYYSASLALLAALARDDRQPR
ncbi:glycosyl hydrolase family 8 [Stutzerimonas azotifigens]|uniref:glycosyl hydrolase family 8 n=1 Tax=Stutzerimonas azotifigens TaxID=291995 RepID=UPI00041C146E|nr:glycosyl hydrolase family 8 [Stutzerimonas azotifigens]